MAEDLSTQARNLARIASSEGCLRLANWYDKVVKDAIVKQAETLHGATLTPSEARARGETLGTHRDTRRDGG